MIQESLQALDCGFDLITSGFECRDQEDVTRFLRENPFLAPLLREGREAVARCFGAETRMALEVFRDPEDAANSEELFLLIQTTDNADAAMEKRERLDADWWRVASRRTQCQMNVSLEFI